MSVFTIYCHGTGSHRDKADKEIVCFMGRRATGIEYQDYLILDGVGAKPKNKEGKNPKAGTFNWADKNKSLKGKTPKELGGGSSAGVLASATGEGVEDNARHAIVTIANLPTLPDTVNLIGWSRGAVTCIVIANMLFDPTTTEGLFRSIKVNIFAVDPVAGREQGHGKHAESRRLIPPTVKNFLGVLATGENRETFKPQDLSRVQVVDPASSNVVFLPFPGKHNTVAQNGDPKAKEVSDICWTLAHRFVDHFNTLQSIKPTLLSNAQMLEAYSGMVVKAAAYAKIKQKGLFQRVIGLGFGKREFAKSLDQYVQHSGYFINEHHRSLFQIVCPRLYDWLFTKTHGSNGLTSKMIRASDPIGQEIAAADASRPNFIESLEKLGVVLEKPLIRLPGPGSAMDSRQVHDLQARGSLQAMGVL